VPRASHSERRPRAGLRTSPGSRAGRELSRVAIVTGAGTGIGAAISATFSRHGLDVVLVGRRAEPLEEVCSQLEGGAVAVAADVGDPAAPELIVESTLDAFGRIDVVANNAAILETSLLPEATRASFDRHYAVNVAGPMFLLAAALPSLREGEHPSVINLSSSVGSTIKPTNTVYGSTKAALEYLTRAWAYELAQDGIRVNCIAPGPVDTPIHATYSDNLDATYAEFVRGLPMARMGHVDDVAVWAWTLASPKTAWTTGNVIHADGGQVLGLPESARA